MVTNAVCKNSIKTNSMARNHKLVDFDYAEAEYKNKTRKSTAERGPAGHPVLALGAIIGSAYRT